MELKNLHKIFNGEFFRVPDYQRGYSWGNDQLKDLWRDIDNLQKGKGHYTGVLSVREKKDGKEIFVVDGQQRIISLLILIQAILNRAAALGETRINGRKTDKYVDKYLREQLGNRGEVADKPIFGYDEDNPSHFHFKKEILNLPGTGSAPSPTLYTRNLDNAMDFFQGKVSSMEFEQLNSLFVKVTENLKFNYYSLDNDFDECVVFESMNNRGKSLSVLELLKNRLIYLGTLLSSHDEQEEVALCKRTTVNGAWKTIYEYLGKGEEALDDDEFLRDHWVMNFPYGKKKSQGYREFLLREHFTAEQVHSGGLDYPAIRKYAEDIEGAVKPFYYLNYPRESAQESRYSPKIQKWLFKLNRLGFGDFQPLLISVLMRREDDSQIVTLLEAAERFLFVAFNVEIRRADYRRSAFYGMARDYHKRKRGLSDVISELRGFPLRKFSKEEFRKKIRDEYESSFYGWKGIEYFLYEYELHLQREHGGETKLEYVNADTIEHIYPQTPRKGWGHFRLKKEKDLLHDLGNLLPLSEKLNSKLGNAPFAEKKKAFSSNSHSAINISKYRDWTPETVDDRREKMLDFLVKRWKLPLTD